MSTLTFTAECDRLDGKGRERVQEFRRVNQFALLMVGVMLFGSTLVSTVLKWLGSDSLLVKYILLYGIQFVLPIVGFCITNRGQRPRELMRLRRPKGYTFVLTIFFALAIQPFLMCISSLTSLLFHNYLNDSMVKYMEEPLGITMFFGGGMIPTFILINQLHMVNTIWAILIPGAFNVWNMILARTYYQSIPKELREASAIDGATEIQHFFKVMLPVCKPIIAVLALWSFVGMWNSYFDAMIYLNDANLQPLQLVLRSILVQNTPQPGMIADIQSTAEMAKVAEQLKYATIVVSSLPLLVMYPFFQKYFDKGIMVGSVKG